MSETEQRAQKIATQLFEALQSRAWDRAAAMYDLPELGAFKKAQLENFLSLFRDEVKEGEDPVPYIVDPFLLLPRVGERPVIGWPPVGSIQQLADLSPPSFFALYLNAAQETFGDIAVPRNVAAVASEHDDLIHVLYRRDLEAVRTARRRFERSSWMAPPWAVSVLSMRQSGASLAVLPNSELNAERLSKILVFLERDSKATDL